MCRRMVLVLGSLALAACATGGTPASSTAAPARPRVVFDTDANNELDDQHAIAYLLWNAHLWKVEGITSNGTHNGGPAAEQSAEARRVVHLCGADGKIPVFDGATADFESIKPHLNEPSFDGKPAVDFLLQQARVTPDGQKLLVIAVGKLTNVALAVTAEPSLVSRMKVVWLGSNWPRDANEYNEANDRASVNAVIDSGIELDVATVRGFGKPVGQNGGTMDVQVTTAEIKRAMPGLGPKVSPVEGRHGGSFTTFGDYSVELFAKMGHERRALFDMAAVAVVKNPAWAKVNEVPAPHIVGQAWQERPGNPHRIRFLTDFDRDAIMDDFFKVMREPLLP